MADERLRDRAFEAPKKRMRLLAHLFVVGILLLASAGPLWADMMPRPPTGRPWDFNRVGRGFSWVTPENVVLVGVALAGFEGLCVLGLIAARKRYARKQTAEQDGTSPEEQSTSGG
ncbi:MAG: hypothetical protein AB1646_13895 [Thermodesulfobacteriota bacterium]